ncbi:hypothetical protein [Verrucomicrobium sp. BvORR034]|uniref:hypothetical protein n=1 Tax=Verrucomicrobium sp. BvORR034 TaxID=1396418 RepID=UPI0006799A0E|nr:hypothetical protein [Verrucomicrobium sp. BvORR034]
MNTNAILSLPAEEDIENYLRVKAGVAGGLVVADAADAAEVLGHNIGGPVDSDQRGRNIVAMQKKNVGIHYAVAAGEITLASPKIKGADNGRVQAHGGAGTAEGVALQPASGAGQIIQVMYF